MQLCPGPAALTPSKFPFWLLMMKCKNNTRSCVPTCLPEYSAIMDNSRILQPLQPAAALLPSGSYSLFNRISRRGLSFFCITQVQKQRAIISIFIFLCTKKPHWHIGWGKNGAICYLWKNNLYDMMKRRIALTTQWGEESVLLQQLFRYWRGSVHATLW